MSVLMAGPSSARVRWEELLFIEHLGYARLCPKTISFSLLCRVVPCVEELTNVIWGVN